MLWGRKKTGVSAWGQLFLLVMSWVKVVYLDVLPPSLPCSLHHTTPSLSLICPSCWQLCTVASFCLSSPHPGPERVPPIRSCQRNAWKSLTAVAAKKPLSLHREDTGGVTSRGKAGLRYFFHRPPAVIFLKNPWQAECRDCTSKRKQRKNINTTVNFGLVLRALAVRSEAAGFD